MVKVRASKNKVQEEKFLTLLDEAGFGSKIRDFLLSCDISERDRMFKFLLLSMDSSDRVSNWPENICRKCLNEIIKAKNGTASCRKCFGSDNEPYIHGYEE